MSRAESITDRQRTGAPVDRRLVLEGVVAILLSAPIAAKEAGTRTNLPSEVAGISIPQTPLTRRAAHLAISSCPAFLFNHCLRTYLFGALTLNSQQTAFDAEIAFVASSLHDLGLLSAFASAGGSFEIDGADRAEALTREAGRTREDGRRVWNAIVAHDMRAEYAAHQSSEAMLVNAGAGADVVDPGDLDSKAVSEVLRVFPRLQFKTRFTALLVDHCRRKPTAQIGWLDGLCRQVVPNASRGSVERAILDAPYRE